VGNARARKVPAQLVEDEDYQLRHERVAGIDIAKAKADVCTRLPPAREGGRRASRVEEFPARAREILDLAARLASDGVEVVIMESTSDYWRMWYYLLESAGLSVQLVNSRHARQLAGRPKTDRLDAQWLARLAEMGLLRPSFVPPPEIRALRQYTRRLVHLGQDRTRSWQRLEKLLEDALCKLTSVISKLAGSVSGRAMIEAMTAGERDPHVLAEMAMTRMRPKIPDLVKAFTGMRFGDQHAFAAASLLREIDFVSAEITALEKQVAAHLATIPAAWGVDADGATGPDTGLGPDAAVLPAAARLDEVTGISFLSAAGIIAEIGLDMSRFPTPDALVSWAGLAPVAVQSGPRKNHGKKGHGNTYIRRLCTLAADAAAGTDTFLGERHCRISSRGGGRKKANVAVGRSILVIVWHLLKDPAARYTDLGPDHYAKHADTSRKTRGHIRQLEALGYDVVVTPREAA
jgi:transposase